MEFNRLLSSAISAYGEPKLTSEKDIVKTDEKQKAIDRKKYYLITLLKIVLNMT